MWRREMIPLPFVPPTLVLLLCALAACGGAERSEPIGTEGGLCYSYGGYLSCDEGLTCNGDGFCELVSTDVGGTTSGDSSGTSDDDEGGDGTGGGDGDSNSSSTSGECRGVASSCFSQFNQYSCYDLDGCYWSSDDCWGSATSCFSYSDSLSCTYQQGCYWSG